MKTKPILVATLLAGAAVCAKGQQATTSSGGDFSGSGGTVAFSIGQTVVEPLSGSSGSVNPGVQQPFEFFTVWVEEYALLAELNVFPNPTRQDVSLTLRGIVPDGMEYRLLDASGRVVIADRIASDRTQLALADLPAAVYVLHITQAGKPTHTFRIIKN
jgi:hypothetical protein